MPAPCACRLARQHRLSANVGVVIEAALEPSEQATVSGTTTSRLGVLIRDRHHPASQAHLYTSDGDRRQMAQSIHRGEATSTHGRPSCFAGAPGLERLATVQTGDWYLTQVDQMASVRPLRRRVRGTLLVGAAGRHPDIALAQSAHTKARVALSLCHLEFAWPLNLW